MPHGVIMCLSFQGQRNWWCLRFFVKHPPVKREDRTICKVFDWMHVILGGLATGIKITT